MKTMKIFLIICALFTVTFTTAACGTKETIPEGKFYSLQEAYDQGLLTHEDLQSIAYYHNGGYFDVNEEFTGWGYDENFTPVPKTPEILNVETENKIKELQAYNLRTREPNATAENVAIIEYYGNSIIIWKT